MQTQHTTSPGSDRGVPPDELLTRLDEIESRLHEALALAQTSCRVCQQALAVTECLRSRIADSVTDSLVAQHAIDQPGGRGQSRTPSDASELTAGSVERLTPRERAVIDLIASGRSNRQIAEVLFLSPRTIERHIANIYLKLDLHTKAEATAWALMHGLIDGKTVANWSVSESEDCARSENYICRLHTSTDA